LKSRFTLLFLILLAVSQPGMAQQEVEAKYASLVEAAQQATSRNDYAAAADDYKEAAKIHPEMPELWANLGLTQHQSGDYAGAIRSFEHALRLKPALYVPNLFLGIDYVQLGNANAAIPLLVRAERMNSKDPEAPLTLGHAYAGQRDFAAAAREFTRVTELDPKRSSAWFARGMAYLDEVEQDARKMSESGRGSSYAEALFAESMVRQSRYHEAADSYTSAIAVTPQPPCLRTELGFLYLKQQNVTAAEQQFKSQRQAEPGCALAALGEARLQIEAGSYAESLALLQQLWKQDHGYLRSNASVLADGLAESRSAGFLDALTQERSDGKLEADLAQLLSGTSGSLSPEPSPSPSPAATDARHRTAEEYYATGQYQRCAAELKTNLPSKSNADILLLSACSYFTGDYELTSTASTALAARSPHSLAALYWSIKANERLALQSLALFEQMEPNSPQTHILLGDMYRQRQLYDSAQAEYKQALSISPDDRAALVGSAYAYFGDANIEATIATAKSALAANAADPELNLLMGEALVARHDFAGAEPFLRKGLTAKPQMLPQVHALLGTVYAETGRTEDAIAQLQMGLPADRDGSTYYKLARMYRKAGDTTKAEQAMQQVKVMEQQRRLGAVTALQDSSPPVADDLAKP
jgi:tetratricopeptide (TPR) repeat protein